MKSPWRRAWQPIPVAGKPNHLLEKSQQQRSLAGYRLHPWGHKELDMNEATEHYSTVSDEHRCKNPQPNISKPNSTIH